MARRGRKRAIIYVRQSTSREESISPEVQIEHCVAACKRNDYDIVPDPVTGALATVDLNLSGRSFKNRSIGPTIDRIANGEADLVVAWKWSRWGRNLVEALLCLAELKQAGGELESATEPIDASTPAGRFSVTQMLAIAEFQSDQIGESWRDAKRSMILKKGLPPTGGHRFGYVYDKGRKVYTPHPVAGPALTWAYQQYLAGASFYSITEYLRRKGIRTSRNNEMQEATLRYAMDSGFAAGLICLKAPEKLLDEATLEEYDLERGQVLFLPNINREGRPAWDPLIPEETWIQYRVRRRRQSALPKRARNATRPLSRLLRCAGCGRRLSFRSDRRYWCCAATGLECQVRVSITEGELHQEVKDWLTLRRDGRDTETIRALVVKQQAARKATSDVTRLEEELRKQEKRRSNLLSLIADEEISKDEARDTLNEIRTSIDQLMDSLMDARRDTEIHRLPPASSFGAVLEGWDFMDPSILNTALSALIDSIYVYPLRTFPRAIIVGRGEYTPDLPKAELILIEDEDGRWCLGCNTFKARSEFYVRKRGDAMLSRCKSCKSEAARDWRLRRRQVDAEGQ